MPTYDYVCQKCGYEFEQFQSMTEEPIKDCPECKSRGAVKRMIGMGAGIIFKGSGFYETDYKRKSSSPSTTGTKEKTDTKPMKTESKKESQPKTDTAKAKKDAA